MTIFQENEVKSRLIGPGAAFLGKDREGPAWDRPGPAGVVLTVPPTRTSVQAYPTHSRPLQGLPGPAPLGMPSLLEQRAGWVVPGIALPGTHPVHPPGTHLGPVPTLPCTKLTVQYTVPNSCFRDTVGEPRGMRTHPCFRVPDGYIQLFKVMRFTRPFAVFFTEFSPCFTEFMTMFY